MFLMVVCQSFEPLHSLSKRGLTDGSARSGCWGGRNTTKKEAGENSSLSLEMQVECLI